MYFQKAGVLAPNAFLPWSPLSSAGFCQARCLYTSSCA